MRSFRTAFPHTFLPAFQRGVLAYSYRGLSCVKCPIDLAIYAKLLWDLRPGSVIEIGSYQGGSALWFADMLTTYGLACPVVSVDLRAPETLIDPRIRFVTGDVNRLGDALNETFLASLPRPWLVIEDSAHTYEATRSVIAFFVPRLFAGEVFVIEDGVIDDLGEAEVFNGGPNRAVRELLETHPHAFRIATEYCDMFGINATYSPNAYLAKL
ncbi:MAG TPA: CmcI family methyltransferase [Methylocella sp.]|nr:CmcI family methyltransferase [Methylocella sp.]